MTNVDDQFARGVRHLVHGFQPIAYEIQQHLLQLNRIPAYRREVRGDGEPYPPTVLACIGFDEIGDFLDDPLDIQRDELGLLLAQKGPEATNNFAGMLARADDVAESLAQLFPIQR